MTRSFPFFVFALLAALQAVKAEDKPRSLSLKQAHEIALKKHPKITVADLKSLAARQVVNQAHAAFLPNLAGNAGGVAVNDPSNTRYATTGLTTSRIFDRVSSSLVLSQLITDFGRSTHLEQSAKFRARAGEQNILATQAQILLQVDGAYMGALQAQALVDVAQQTVKTRKLLRDQVAILAKNQLKSNLDASFAEVNYQEAVLLLSRSENDLASSFATLAALLDDRKTTSYRLTEHTASEKVSTGVSQLIGIALRDRPDLRSLRLEREGAWKFAKAEADLRLPTLGLQGVAGVLPFHDKNLTNNDFAAAGIVLNWPIFTGGLNTARRKEAEFRARAVDADLQDQETSVVRDVRIAWLNVINASERITITAKLLEQAKQSENLATALYNAGKAQLSLTNAQINEANARYEYLIRRSILDYQIGALK